VLYGFDPNRALDDYTYPNLTSGWQQATTVIVEQSAAWIYDGEIGFRSDGLNSWVTEANDAPKVPCFRLSRFIAEQANHSREIILKIDAEGSEYDLLRDLISTRTDALLSLAWVEWHEPDRGRELIEQELACELREWNW
jgi:FkbM family methyltransferase